MKISIEINIRNVPKGEEENAAVLYLERIEKLVADGFTSGYDGDANWEMEKSEEIP